MSGAPLRAGAVRRPMVGGPAMWLTVCLMGCLPGAAGAAAGAPLPQVLQAYYDETRTLAGRFEQRALGAEGRSAVQRGRFWIERPGRYRWEYREPYEQLIVSDGDTLWIYDPALEQVTRRRLDGATDAALPATLLSRATDLGALFELSVDPDAPNRVHLVPRGESAGLERLEIELRQGVPVAMLLEDALGGRTRFSFSHVRRNAPLPDAANGARLFSFEPPPGVDLVTE